MALRIGKVISGVSGAVYSATQGSKIDLAVTGLSRAGKTVFVTSLVHNLLCAGRAIGEGGHSPLEAFIPFKDGRLRDVGLPPSGHRNRPRFPYEECVTALGSQQASWPKRTGSISEIEMRLRFGRPPSKSSKPDSLVADVNLRVVDYPGEWLLDLPMLGQDFTEWSAATLALSGQGSRAKFSQIWRALLDPTELNKNNEDSFCRNIAERYRDYLVGCRDHGLRFLQPGQFLRLEGQDEENVVPILDRPALWFCPLPPPPDGKWKSGSNGAAMAKRYEAYREEAIGKFLKDTFGRFGRQIVLVDVLGALNGGEEVFNDTSRALSEVCGYLRSNSESLLNRIKSFSTGSTIDKIAFAATKADHVPRAQWDNLTKLLGEMLRDTGQAARWKGIEILTTYLAAASSTEQTQSIVDGHKRDVVIGRDQDSGKRVGAVVEELPSGSPSPEYWRRFQPRDEGNKRYPNFAPPPINVSGTSGIPHIGMERLLNFLIADRF